jgi:hypothetical protein
MEVLRMEANYIMCSECGHTWKLPDFVEMPHCRDCGNEGKFILTESDPSTWSKEELKLLDVRI